METIDIFKQAIGKNFLPGAHCWTWSDRLRIVLDDLGEILDKISNPPVIHLKRGAEYDYTFALSTAKELPPHLCRNICAVAQAFLGAGETETLDVLRSSQTGGLDRTVACFLCSLA